MAQLVNKPTKFDLILILSTFIICVALIIFPTLIDTQAPTGFEITVNGKLHSSYSFSNLKNGEIIEINTEYGYNKFMYENQSIRCIDSNCKDKIEIYAGKINKTNQALVCLPHKLMVQITGQNNIDAVSY